VVKLLHNENKLDAKSSRFYGSVVTKPRGKHCRRNSTENKSSSRI